MFPMFITNYITILLISSVTTNNIFKHHYVSFLERVEMENLNTVYCNASFGVRFINRTKKALYGFIHPFVNVPENTYVVMKEYHFFNNEYKLTAIQFKLKLRQVLQVDWLGLQSLYQQSKPPLVWPLKKGITYKINNWIHDDKKIPFPYAPTGYWKLVLGFYLNDETKLFDVLFYDHVVDVVDI